MSDLVNFRKLTPYRTPEESPGFLLWRVSLAWRKAIEDALKPLDLTHPQFVTMTSIAWLTKKSDGVSQAAIGRQSGLDPNTTSQILRVLEEKGFVARTRSADERSKHPVITPEGAACIARALPAVERVNAQFFAPIDLASSGFIESLRKLVG